MTGQVLKMPFAERLECAECGAVGTGQFAHKSSCSCPGEYITAGSRAQIAIKANPKMSNRALANVTGLSEPTVRRARTGASNDAPEKRTGQDGKSYPTTRRAPDPDKPTRTEVRDAKVTARSRVFLRFAADMLRKLEQGAGLKDATAAEISPEIERALDDLVTACSKLRDDIINRKD